MNTHYETGSDFYFGELQDGPTIWQAGDDERWRGSILARAKTFGMAVTLSVGSQVVMAQPLVWDDTMLIYNAIEPGFIRLSHRGWVTIHAVHLVSKTIDEVKEINGVVDERDLGAEIPSPERVKEIRSSLGMTQAQFAAEVRYAVETVSAWERGKLAPGPEAARAIQRAFARKTGQMPPELESVVYAYPMIINGDVEVFIRVALGDDGWFRLFIGHDLVSTHDNQVDAIRDARLLQRVGRRG